MIRLNKTEDTPQVIFDKQANVFEIRGRSLPEDAAKFYAPLHDWMRNYVRAPNPETTLHIDLEYFNSSSIKQLVILLFLLEDILKTGNRVNAVWSYSKNDELIEAKGEEIRGILTLPFEMKPV